MKRKSKRFTGEWVYLGGITMTYNYDEMFNEVLSRRNVVRQRREKRIDAALVLTSVLMVVFMISALFLQTNMTTVQNPTVYGALMLSSSNGVFVLVAVAAFVLGIAVTLLSVRKQKHDKNQETETGKF